MNLLPNLDTGLLLLLLALFCYWLDFVWGHPLSSDFNAHAILFFIPYRLAEWRLKQLDKLHEFKRFRAEQLLNTKDKKARTDIEWTYKANVYETGMQYFTYERAILCPICFHWWLSLPILLSDVSLEAWFYYFVTHFIIRKILLS